MHPPAATGVPLSSFALLALVATAAHAQQPDPADGAVLPRVEVKASVAHYDPRRDDTATRIVIGREDIVRYGDTSVLDVLKRIPGITVETNTGRGGEIRMRGVGGGYTQVLINGQRAPAGFTFDSLAPDVIERIEVLRAATAEFSTQSVAGTINIVLKRMAKKAQRDAKLGLMHSDTFKGPSATLELGDRTETFSYAIAANATRERFTRTANGFEDTRLPDDRASLLRETAVPEQGRIGRLNLSPRLNWTLDDGATLSSQTFLNVNRFRNRTRVLVTTLLGAEAPVPEWLSTLRADGATLRSDLTWARELASGAKMEAKIGLTGREADDTIRSNGVDPAGTPAFDKRISTATRDRGVNTSGKTTRSLAGGHVLAAGWDGSLDTRDQERVERDTVRAAPPGLPMDERFDARVARLAFFGQDEWAITPQWSMYLGVRWESIRTRVSGNAIDAARLRSSVWSPIMQTLWKLPGTKGDQLRFALTRTYKAPGADSLVPRRQTWENNSATEADYQGNPNLRPELAWGIDAAWEHYWADGAMVSVNGALRRIRDYTSNRVYFDGLRWIFTPANEDRAELRSLGLETKLPLKSVLAGAPAIDLRAGVSRNWSEVDSVPGPDNRIEQQTPLSANLGADYTAGKLSAGGSVAFRNAGMVRVAANRGYYAHARTDLETYALWKFDPKRQLRIALSNMLGEDRGWEISYDDPVTGLEKRRWHYPDGVRVRATFEMKL
ncbi:TonB-dependent receptor plug domain-containing protein [Massilia niastensis]|uniref:TonB-dependent receptor plug domain-containing protein n=1 Tax=Massilia niastensis TaxID=544911 RepID=UPI000380E780|nr:TonB-dependent receptor [Massilia niastensis]